MLSTKELMEGVVNEVQGDFAAHRPIMGFHEFVDLMAEEPARHLRNSVQYLRDCFLHFGTSKSSGGPDRYNLFDCDFDEGRSNRLVGHELVQERVFRLLENFVSSGRVNKLILLHGPNGSAKSTFVNTVMRGMEAYSQTEAGALYRFNWVFPNEKKTTGGTAIGFGGFNTRTAEDASLKTFAYLDEHEIDAKIPSDLNDHPIILIPAAARKRMIATIVGENEAMPALSDYIREGNLSHTSRQIFDALMSAYRGDLDKVLKHVQIERFYVSKRYRVGAVTIEPQMRVDAGLRQLTVDRSLSALPSSLQNQTLFEPFGDLVDANRGIVEYDDMFKRHPDLNKYLLATSEKATVSLENRILHLDSVLVATANEDYLEAYKQSPDYSSFKGRVELVRVPYLLDYTIEADIYEDQLGTVASVDHVAPHTTYVAALWAVLTRLRRPQSELYPSTIQDVVAALDPIEKAELYALGRVPKGVTGDKARELLAVVPDLMDEAGTTSDYEGRMGASPREMKIILLNASQNPNFASLSPLAVFEEIETLVKDVSVFPFLQMKPDGDYYRHDNFINTVRERYLDILNDETLEAMGLVEGQQYQDLFSRYVDNVSQSLKGEKVYNKATNAHVPPDEKFMSETEALFGVTENVDDFRNGLIATIAAYSIDNPGVTMAYPDVFPSLFHAMRRSFFQEREKLTRRILVNVMRVFDDDDRNLSRAEKTAAETTIDSLINQRGYNRESAREAVAFLYSNRYKSSDS